MLTEDHKNKAQQKFQALFSSIDEEAPIQGGQKLYHLTSSWEEYVIWKTIYDMCHAVDQIEADQVERINEVKNSIIDFLQNFDSLHEQSLDDEAQEIIDFLENYIAKYQTRLHHIEKEIYAQSPEGQHKAFLLIIEKFPDHLKNAALVLGTSSLISSFSFSRGSPQKPRHAHRESVLTFTENRFSPKIFSEDAAQGALSMYLKFMEDEFSRESIGVSLSAKFNTQLDNAGAKYNGVITITAPIGTDFRPFDFLFSTPKQVISKIALDYDS